MLSAAIIDKNVAVRVTNKTESPYTVKKTQIVEFSVVTPQQPKFVEPLDAAILIMIREDGPDLTAYVNQHFISSNSEKQTGCQRWKILAELRIIPQHKQESPQSYTNWKKKVIEPGDDMRFQRILEPTHWTDESANTPERKPNGCFGSDAQIWNIHISAFSRHVICIQRNLNGEPRLHRNLK